MISFIVIGKNEGWKLSKSIQSIFDSVKVSAIELYEIIYVDSNSNDDSISRAKKFKDVKVLRLSGTCNAGIARNVGAKLAKGKTLVFMDGDMQLIPTFISKIFSDSKGLINGFISSNWINYLYDKRDVLLNKEVFLNITSDRYESTTGGFIIIDRNIWDKTGGFDERLIVNEDIDFGIRLDKMGVKLLRKKDIGFIHHTIAYLNKDRMWTELRLVGRFFSKSLLYKKHFFHLDTCKRFLRNEYSLFILVFLLISLVILPYRFTIYLIFIYVSVLLIRSKFNINSLIYYLTRDVLVFVGFFLHQPKRALYQVESI